MSYKWCSCSLALTIWKKLSQTQKALSTLKIFGIKFTAYYFLKYIITYTLGNSIESYLRKNIPIIYLNKSINSSTSVKIANHKPDLLISIQGNQIFKKDLINLAPKGCINLHTALLPKYRGLMPSFWVLKIKKKTGVSVFFVNEGIDSGPILVQREIYIDNMTHSELISKSKQIGMECIIDALNKILVGDISTIPNNDDEMTYYGFPERKDVIEFHKAGAKFF